MRIQADAFSASFVAFRAEMGGGNSGREGIWEICATSPRVSEWEPDRTRQTMKMPGQGTGDSAAVMPIEKKDEKRGINRYEILSMQTGDGS